MRRITPALFLVTAGILTLCTLSACGSGYGGGGEYGDSYDYGNNYEDYQNEDPGYEPDFDDPNYEPDYVPEDNYEPEPDFGDGYEYQWGD